DLVLPAGRGRAPRWRHDPAGPVPVDRVVAPRHVPLLPPPYAHRGAPARRGRDRCARHAETRGRDRRPAHLRPRPLSLAMRISYDARMVGLPGIGRFITGLWSGLQQVGADVVGLWPGRELQHWLGEEHAG